MLRILNKRIYHLLRKKMEEMAAEEEAEARRERIEAALDVTKQKDLSGFYRHIYRSLPIQCHFA